METLGTVLAIVIIIAVVGAVFGGNSFGESIRTGCGFIIIIIIGIIWLASKSVSNNTDNEGLSQKQSFASSSNYSTQSHQPQTQPSSPSNNSRWDSDWGNGIHAIAQTTPCQFNDYKTEGYQYTISATIPLSRLAKTEDAWNIIGDRAQTLYGCWLKRSDGLVQYKMVRKKDSKLFQEVLNFDDGSWTLSTSQ